MERTCRCGKEETCQICKAWWAARALNPPTICRGSQWLDYDDRHVVWRECEICGNEIPDPYDTILRRFLPMTCSSCDAQYSPKPLEGNDLPAVCDCARFFLAHGGLGWDNGQCDAHKCWPPTMSKKASARQGNLF